MKQAGAEKIAVFGYGSLVNLASLHQTIGRPPETTHYVNLQGWTRDWTIAVANDSLQGRYVHAHDSTLPDHILALNIQRNPASAFGVNGVLFDATKADLQNLDAREFCYKRIDVTNDILGNHPFTKIYTYVGLATFLVKPEQHAVIPQSYEQVVAEGFKSINNLAYLWYKQSTTPSTYQTTPTKYILV
jgi:cation transport regulator ChaC